MSRYDKSEFYQIVHEILVHPEFQKRKKFAHHGEESVYAHSLQVSFIAYRLAKRMHLDARSAAIGGLLHDFYTTPWMDAKKPDRFRDMHGFVHAKQAYRNAIKYFPHLMTPKIKDIITKHMFPLNINPPKYKESWVVTLADKIASTKVFLNPKDLPMYVGIRKRKK